MNRRNNHEGEIDRTRRGVPLPPDLSKPEVVRESLAVKDLTAEHSKHAVNLIKEGVTAELLEQNFPNVTALRGDPVVSVADNFDRLGYEANAIGRSSIRTRYIDENHILRTQLASLMPARLEKMSDQGVGQDTTFVLSGLAFRRDVIDQTHAESFHQLGIWRVARSPDRPLGTEHLTQLVATVLAEAGSPRKLITRKEGHPFLLDSVDIHIQTTDEPVKLLEVGFVHPGVLRKNGLNPEEYSGIALNAGLDRLVMARKNIRDIRFLRAENSAIASQMFDLLPFQEYTDLSMVSRDILYAVPAEATLEDVCEGLREGFGPDACLIQAVSLKSVRRYAETDAAARAGLGLKPNQKSVLVRVTLGHPDCTIRREQVHDLCQRVYPRIHQGTRLAYGY